MNEQVRFLEEENKRLRELYNDVLADNEILAKENESMRKKIYGLETTVTNYKEKEKKRYAELGWPQK